MKKLALLLPLVALTLSACNGDKTSTTPTVVTPYDATGNWQLASTSVDVSDGSTHTSSASQPLTITMTNKSTGDFSGTYPAANTGQPFVGITGNTVNGKITILAEDDTNGNPTYIECVGSFNTSTNIYYTSHCYPQGATDAEKAAIDAKGSGSITMTRQ